jgi:hypothetical protein
MINHYNNSRRDQKEQIPVYLTGWTQSSSLAQPRRTNLHYKKNTSYDKDAIRPGNRSAKPKPKVILGK